MKEFSTLNENKSTEHCQIIIQQLSAALDQRISQRKFLKPGGYMLFLEEKRTIMAKYDTAPNKGLKSLEVLQEFMNNLKVIEATILQADESLTAKEKQIAESQAEAEAAKRQRQILEEQARSLQESLENQKKSYEQHEKMLIEKMESDRRNLIAENERMIDQKLQEQSAMLTAGHQSNVNALQGEINGLKGKNRDILLLPCVIS
ncbi:hypothetical protein XELAEV_18001974mg [Xenopus laevis]|nr:hypothetical protein XELAEV_18001974mg [Xenopus laevis]